MKLITTMFMLVLLVGCASKPQHLRADPDHNLDVVTIKFVPTNVLSKQFKIVNGYKLNAVSTYIKGTPECTIYAPEPSHIHDKQAFQSLGHEMWHCFKGEWHHQPKVTQLKSGNK